MSAGSDSTLDVSLKYPHMKPNTHRQGVFISYSHKDEKWLDEIRTHLKPHMRGEKFFLWDDQQIEAGSKWSEAISNALDTARVAVLLVSPDFLASNYIMSVELPRMIERAETDNLTILWIPIRESAYGTTELSNYQAAFPPSEPLATLSKPKRDSAFTEIAATVARAVDINSVANSLQIIDALSADASAYTEGRPEPDDHSYEIAARQKQMSVSLSQGEHDLTTITADDLVKLPSEQRQLIRSHERVMQDLFDRWTELKPRRSAMDGDVRERARTESDSVLTELCSELNELLDFIEFMGMQLYDHYMHVRFVCRSHQEGS